jgi:predicted TIM-barrel fold metal-dependent hydrolase
VQQFKVVSTDSHVSFPDDEATQRIPKKYREQLPELSQKNDAEQAAKARKRAEKARALMNEDDLARYERWGRGVDIARRIEDQDRDGVCAEVVFGPLQLHQNLPDPEIDMALARAFNDWAAEIFGEHADRFAVSAHLPVGDIPLAVAEVYRVAGLGFRCVNMPAQQIGRPYNRPDYDPLWAALEETGLVANFHIGTGHDPQAERGPGATTIQYIVLSQADGPSVVAYLCAGGVCQRFPHLKWSVVEGGAAWLAWVLTQMDESHRKHHMHHRPEDRLELMPSEYFKRQGHATFMNDPVALWNRRFTGSDVLMFGTDYPHHEGTFPRTQEICRDLFADIPDDEAAMIAGGNAAKLYGFGLS